MPEHPLHGLHVRAQFATLSAPLVTAAQDYGFTISTSSDEVIDLADEAASAAWRAARTAWHAIAPLVGLRIAMSSTFDVSPTRSEARAAAFPRTLRVAETNYSICFAEGDNWSLERGFYVEGKTVGHLDWFALAAGGLRLNTPDPNRDRHPHGGRQAEHVGVASQGRWLLGLSRPGRQASHPPFGVSDAERKRHWLSNPHPDSPTPRPGVSAEIST